MATGGGEQVEGGLRRIRRPEFWCNATRSPVQNLGGVECSGLVGGSGLVGRDPPGSLTIRVVHSFSGSWALGFQPWKGRWPEEKYFMYTRGIIGKKNLEIFQKGYLSDLFFNL